MARISFGTIATVFLAAAMLALAPAGPAGAQQVTGENVKMVAYDGGAFVQVGRLRWVEVSKSTWKTMFQFRETYRDAREVKLWDRDRRVHISLLLAGNNIWYAPDGSPLTPLYDIVATSTQSRITVPASQGWTIEQDGWSFTIGAGYGAIPTDPSNPDTPGTGWQIGSGWVPEQTN